MWLKQFNSCPTCRCKLPSKEDEQEVSNSDVSNEVTSSSDTMQTDEASNSSDGEKDEEDVIVCC